MKFCDKCDTQFFCCYVTEGCVRDKEPIAINKLNKEYPFNEGDDYWTIEDGEVIWSCWDDVSEEIHDENPDKEYFKSEEEAESYRLTKLIEIVKTK